RHDLDAVLLDGLVERLLLRVAVRAAEVDDGDLLLRQRGQREAEGEGGGQHALVHRGSPVMEWVGREGFSGTPACARRGIRARRRRRPAARRAPTAAASPWPAPALRPRRTAAAGGRRNR